MSKQKDSGAALALDRAVHRWDYDVSVSKMRPMVRQWKKATLIMARELYLAKEFLTGQKGQYKDPEADDYLLYSWSSYCEEIGLTYQTANNWIKSFIPKELSGTGKDVLLIDAPAKTETTADRALMDARIEKVLRTGKRPADWSAKEESEYKRRMESARYLKLAEELNMPVVARAKHDHFADILKRSKDIENFQLADRHQILAQAVIFDHIEAYLKTFIDPEVQAQAAFNLALKTRNRANEIAEMNIQLSEAIPTKDEENDGE
jgi:hypothetical protein